MENILQQILEGQTKLVETVDKIVVRLDKLEEGQARLEEKVTHLTQDVAHLTEGQARLTKDQARLEENITVLTEGQARLEENVTQLTNGQAQIILRLDTVDQRLQNVEYKLSEHTRFISALSQDVARTATKDSIETLVAKVDLLNNKVFNTEAAIALLKIVK